MYVICVEINIAKQLCTPTNSQYYAQKCLKTINSHLTRGDVEDSEMGLRQPVDQLGISFLTTDTVIMKFSAKVKVL